MIKWTSLSRRCPPPKKKTKTDKNSFKVSRPGCVMICAVSEYVFVWTELKRREFKVTAVIIHAIRSAKGDNVESKETLNKYTFRVKNNILQLVIPLDGLASCWCFINHRWRLLETVLLSKWFNALQRQTPVILTHAQHIGSNVRKVVYQSVNQSVNSKDTLSFSTALSGLHSPTL